MAEINFAGFAPELSPNLGDQVVGYRTPTSGGERRTQYAAILALFKNNLGAITVASVNGVIISGSSSPALSVIGTASVSGTNTGDQDLSGYLTQAAAAATYLSKAEASSTYLTQASAAATYLTQANAAATYLTQAAAAAAYQPLSAALSALAGGSAFVRFIGPTTSIKSFTLPDASGTLLTTANAVLSVTGTANEITASPATGAVTLSLPAALTFTGKAVTGGTFNGPTLTAPALGTPISGVATNLTGTALGLAAGNVITNANLSGDVSSVGNVTTLATVNASPGTFGSAALVPIVTVNGKGLVTSVTTVAAGAAAAGSLTGTTLAANVVNASLNSITPAGGTLGVTGAISATGNLTLSGTTAATQRMIINTNGAAAPNRFAFQESVANGAMSLFALPNGTNPISSMGVANDSAYTNANRVRLAVTGTVAQIISDAIGSATSMPLEVVIQSTTVAAFAATGLTVNGITSTSGDFRLNGLSYNRVAVGDGSSNWLGGYNSKFVGSTPSRDSLGAATAILHGSTPFIAFYVGASAAAGVAIPEIARITATGLAVTGGVTATSGGVFNGLTVTGAITTLGANRTLIDFAAYSRVIGLGANTGTRGSVAIACASSDASLYTDVCLVTGSGLAVTGTLSTTGTVQFAGEGIGTSSTVLGVAFSGALGGISLRSTDDVATAYFSAFRKASGVIIGAIIRVGTTDAVAFNTTSDARLKTNVRDFTGADSGPIIDGLRPRWFDWKRAGEDGCNIIGLIAQEEAAVEPALMRCGAVTAGDDGADVGRQWQRSDAALVPILIAELKALRARTAALEAKQFNN